MSVHLRDHHGHVVGCSLAADLCDYQGIPVGVGLCNCHDPLDPIAVDVPMPAFTPVDHSLVEFDFTGKALR